MQLRPAQADILAYTGGRMAVSAVPGSGKTFTLALLAAELVARGLLHPDQGQQVLIVTYLNASVDTFRARVLKRLAELSLPPEGIDVRTLHSLALEIVRVSGNHSSLVEEPLIVADEGQIGRFLAMAVDSWIDDNRQLWHSFLADESPQSKVRWREVTERTARSFVRTAKNERYSPEQVMARLEGRMAGWDPLGPNWSVHNEESGAAAGNYTLTWMLAGIYRRYQQVLQQQGALDFDDLIWQATVRLEGESGLANTLRERWPYVLEDEAQDSVPLQETLLKVLTGPTGNWVRVGDPNQAITSTFTAAHPRHFVAFLRDENVVRRSLPNSGRSAPLIFEAANRLVQWVGERHPADEVREAAFIQQKIEPTPPGDSQPNPPDSAAWMGIRVYRHREDEELPSVAKAAAAYSKRRSSDTVAILVPTNELGRQVAGHLDELDVDYDDLLRGGGRQREIASALQALVALLADPQGTRALEDVHAALFEIDHPAALMASSLERMSTILRSVHRPEAMLFPQDGQEIETALPIGIATEIEVDQIGRLARFLREVMALRALPADDLLLSLGELVFTDQGRADQNTEADLAIVYQLAYSVRTWLELQPEWRLPEIAAQLKEIAEGRRTLPGPAGDKDGFEPVPGRVTLATQHGAKGMEWDAVFLVGLDGFWIPNSLDSAFMGEHGFLGGDPVAESAAQLRYLMVGDTGLFPGRDATASAHIEIISERLRLLYVGITRARRYLQLSRSRGTRRFGKAYDAEPTTVMGVLYDYLQGRDKLS